MGELSKSELNKKALKSGLLFTICQFVVRGLSFLVTPFFARVLSTAQFGMVKIFESWILIFVPLVTLGLYRSVEVARFDRPNYSGYVSNTVALGGILSIAFGGICWVFLPQVSSLLGMEPWMIAPMVFYVFAEFSVMCFYRREKQLMRSKYLTAVSVLLVFSATFSAVGMLLYGVYHGQSERLVYYRLMGYYVPYNLLGSALGLFMLFRWKSEKPIDDWKYGLAFSVPLVAELLSIQVMNQIDRIMIDRMVGHSEAGIYALATTVSYILWILEESVWSAWLPWLYEKITRKEIPDIQPLWDKMMWIFAALSWSVILAAPELIAILGGKKYSQAAFVVAPLILSTLFRFYSNSFSAVQNYCKKTQYVALSTVIVMVLNVCLNYFGIHTFGYIGAAYATAVSYFALMVIQAFFERQVTGLRVVRVGRTFMTALVTFAIGVGLIKLYPLHTVLRFLIAAALCGVIAYQNRDMIPQKYLPRKRRKDNDPV